MDIQILPIVEFSLDRLLPLYRQVGWSAYYSQPQKLLEAFQNSLYVLGAYDGDMLIGLVRVVGDGVSVVFVQDLLVHPDYQRRGIGRQLMGHIFARYCHVRQLHLLTDDSPSTTGFYRAIGMRSVDAIHCVAFTRVK